MITAVLFDLFETLVTERHTTPSRAASLGERLGVDAQAFRNVWRTQRRKITCGELSFSDALFEIGARLGRRFDTHLVRRISDERRLEKAAVLERFDRAAVDALCELRRHKLRLAIVSNCFAEDVAGWSRCRASALFDATVFSFEVGAAKPDRLIYVEAIERLGVKCAEAMFVGDGGDDELAGAERAGLRAAQACWFADRPADCPPHIRRLSSWQMLLDLAARRRRSRELHRYAV
jgi:putative hydrolase of the HAD superfamily